MDIYTLIRNYKNENPDGHYFDKETLKWFGERLSEMRVLKGAKIVTDLAGNEHEVVILSKLSRNHPCGPTRTYDYFDVNTWDTVCVKD